MKRIVKIRLFLVTMIMTMLVGTTAFAYDGDLNDWLSTDGKGYIEMLLTSKVLRLDQDPSCIDSVTLNGTKYYYNKETLNKEIDKIVSALNAQQQAANEASKQQQDVINDLNEALPNVKPDIRGAVGIFDGAMDGINFVVGLLITFITVSMTLITACDIVFLTVPPFQSFCDNMKVQGASGNGGAAGFAVSHGRSEKAGETRLKFITDEAEFALKTANLAETGKLPITIYLTKRALNIIAITVALFILCTGNITLITNMALKAVSGLLDLITRMGSKA